MKKIILSLVLGLTMIFANLSAYAEPLFKGYYDYEGTLDKSKNSHVSLFG